MDAADAGCDIPGAKNELCRKQDGEFCGVSFLHLPVVVYGTCIRCVAYG